MKQIEYTKEQQIVLDVISTLTPLNPDNFFKNKVKSLYKKYDIKPLRIIFYDYLYHLNNYTTLHVRCKDDEFEVRDIMDFMNDEKLMPYIPNLKNYYVEEIRDKVYGNMIDQYSRHIWIVLHDKED